MKLDKTSVRRVRLMREQGGISTNTRVGDDYPVVPAGVMPLCWLVVPGSHELSVPVGRRRVCIWRLITYCQHESDIGRQPSNFSQRFACSGDRWG